MYGHGGMEVETICSVLEFNGGLVDYIISPSFMLLELGVFWLAFGLRGIMVKLQLMTWPWLLTDFVHSLPRTPVVLAFQIRFGAAQLCRLLLWRKP